MSCDKNMLVFGGTFNPPHYGHLIFSRAIIERTQRDLKFDKCYLLPNGDAPHKQGEIDPDHRFKMCELAVQGDPQFMVSDLESSRKGKSYTIETVETLRDIFRNHVRDVWWIIGPDNLSEIETWHRFSEFPNKINFLVGIADGKGNHEIYDLREKYLRMGIMVIFVEIPRIDIRSTLIRTRVSLGLPIRYMVPPSVEDYIREHKLYQ